MTDQPNEQCPRCFGRGYLPEARKPSKRNPNGLGFYARTCPRCSGSGSVPVCDLPPDVDDSEQGTNGIEEDNGHPAKD